jgi:riboflavin synthase
MFSGIVEAHSSLQILRSDKTAITVSIERPPSFDDLKIGDSVAVNGVCLTLETQSPTHLQFTLGAETLRVLGLDLQSSFFFRAVHLERSLRWGDRVHGALVSGHVDGVAKVVLSVPEGSCWRLDVELPESGLNFVWLKGSITLSGVNLTINDVQERKISVTLIPETILRTHLSQLEAGDSVFVEFDWMAKSVYNTHQRILERNSCLTLPKN